MGTENKRTSVATVHSSLTAVVLLILVSALAFVLIRQDAAQQDIHIGSSTPAAEVWTPPENPHPLIVNNIPDEARHDTRAGRYAEALAKHVWYHENALEYGTRQDGVRLVFALRDWVDLAKQYPPAMVKLKAVQDEAEKKAVSARRESARQYFIDFVAISENFEETEKVRELFLKLHKANPDRAKDVYRFAEEVLIRANEYKLCGEYLDPDLQIPIIIRRYQVNRQRENRYGEPHKRFTEGKMTSDSATLVALLAVNDRQQEAQAAAEAFKDAWDDASYHEAIDLALSGKVPDPWP